MNTGFEKLTDEALAAFIPNEQMLQHIINQTEYVEKHSKLSELSKVQLHSIRTLAAAMMERERRSRKC